MAEARPEDPQKKSAKDLLHHPPTGAKRWRRNGQRQELMAEARPEDPQKKSAKDLLHHLKGGAGPRRQNPLSDFRRHNLPSGDRKRTLSPQAQDPASTSERSLLRQAPEVRAVCGSAA